MGRGLLVAGVALVLGAACTKRNPEVCCTTEADCVAKGLPDGADCDTGLTCINNRCTAPASCQAESDCNVLTPICDVVAGVCVQCLASDDCETGVCDPDTYACRGCVSDGECSSSHCDIGSGTCRGALVPKYLAEVCNTAAAAPYQVTADVTAEATGAFCNAGQLQQPAPYPSICIAHFSAVSIDAYLRVTGLSSVAIIADGDISISGTLTVSAFNNLAGPGSYMPPPPAGPPPTVDPLHGGGGGGFKTAGANGGGSSSNASPAVDYGTMPAFAASARKFTTSGPMQGPGGGAITIISCNGTISVSGLIDASGGGGAGGNSDNGFLGGGGGGAGGHVLLQAWAIEVGSTARILTNGGGGGAGKPANGTGDAFALRGRDGAEIGPLCGDFGKAGTDGGGSGGAGGCRTAAPTAGTAATLTNATGGGGGGSVGFIRTAMPAGRTPVLPNASEPNSPIVEPNETLETKAVAQ